MGTLIRILILCVSLGWIMTAQEVYGHSFVVEKVPAPNSILTESPEEIIITFDKKVDKELALIQISDEHKQNVTENSTMVSKDRLSISLLLPKLSNGIYHVEFYVISSNDGHPIQGRYDFKVNKPKVVNENNNLPNKITQPLIDDTSASTPEIEQSDQFGWSSLVHFVIRFIYFSGLMMVVGWVFWRNMMPQMPNDIKNRFLFWGIIFQMVHIFGLIAMILIQLNMFGDFCLTVQTEFPFGSSFSMLWLVSLLLSIIGFICLFKNIWFDQLFVYLLLIAKSLNGHATENDPALILVINNAIHIIAGSVWAAGLAIIVLFNSKYRVYTKAFLPHFSKTALWCICIVSLTGTITFVLFDPDWSNAWTLLVLLKVCTVVGVLLVGTIIRLKMRKGKVWNLVKIDLGLSLIIILIVSILTYLSPHL